MTQLERDELNIIDDMQTGSVSVSQTKLSNDDLAQRLLEERNDAKSNARSRNHYGHKYTLLKMDNHTLKVQLAKLTEQTVKACDRAYYGGAIVGVVVTLIAIVIVHMLKKGVV